MVRLMAISSKRAYAIPRSTAPRSPAPAAVHCWPIPPQETLRVLSQSLWGLWVLVHTRYVWTLWASLAGVGFDSKHDFTPLLSWWGFFFAPGHGVSPQSCSSTVQPPLQRLPSCWCLYYTVYYTKCAISLCLKVYISEFLNTLLLKNANHHLSLQEVLIFWLVECLTSMLMATNWSGWWLLKGWQWQFKKK